MSQPGPNMRPNASASPLQPPRPTGQGMYNDRDKVLAFLRSTGLHRAHAAMLKDMADIEPYDTRKTRDQHLIKLREAVGSSFTTMLVPAAQNYEAMYKELREWSRNCLDEFQLPLILVAYPIMLHIFLLLITELEDPRDSLEFLRRHAWEHFPVRGDEILQLLSVRPDRSGLMNHPSTSAMMLNQPVSVTIPKLAHSLLCSHLLATKNSLLLDVLARRIVFTLTDSSTALPEIWKLANELTISSAAELQEQQHLATLNLKWGPLPESWASDQQSKLDRHRRLAMNNRPGMTGNPMPRYDSEPTEPMASINPALSPVPLPEKSSLTFVRAQSRQFSSLLRRIDVSSIRPPRVLRFNADPAAEATAMALSGNGGHMVAVGSQSGDIRLTCLHAKVQQQRRQQEEELGVTSLGVLLRGESGKDKILDPTEEDGTAAASAEAFVWGSDVSKWILPKDLIGHEGAVSSLDFSHDERMLLSGGLHDGSVRIWSVDAAAPVAAIDQAHTNGVHSCKWFTPYDSYFLTCGADGFAKMWSPTNPSLPLRVFGVRTNGGKIHSAVPHPNSSLVVTGGDDRIVRVWDVRAARCCRLLAGASSASMSLAVSHAGRLVASGGVDGSVSLWDLPTGRILASVQGHKNFVTDMDFSRGSLLLATGGVEGTVRLWDVADASHGRLVAQTPVGVIGSASANNVQAGAMSGPMPMGMGGVNNMNKGYGYGKNTALMPGGHLFRDRSTLHPVRSLTATGARVATVKFTGSNLLMVGSLYDA